MFVLPLAHYNIYHCAARASFHVNLHFRHLNLLLKVWLRKPMSIILSGLRNLMSKMHVCLSLHPSRLGINACLFSLRPSIRIFIIPRRVLPLVVICTFSISTFYSKFDCESVCLASSLVFKISQKAALFLYLHISYRRHKEPETKRTSIST